MNKVIEVNSFFVAIKRDRLSKLIIIKRVCYQRIEVLLIIKLTNEAEAWQTNRNISLYYY